MTRFIKLLVAVAILTGCTSSLLPIIGNGKLIERTIQVGTFDSLDISGVIDLEFIVADTPRVVIYVDENLQNLQTTNLSRGVLAIGIKPYTSIRASRGSIITVYGPSITELVTSGTGDVTIAGINLTHKDFSLISSGTGDCTLQGQVTNLDIRSSGTGNIYAKTLTTNNVHLTLSGVGDCHIMANTSITGSMSGIGDLYYYGKPAHFSVQRSGLGDIIRR